MFSGCIVVADVAHEEVVLVIDGDVLPVVQGPVAQYPGVVALGREEGRAESQQIAHNEGKEHDEGCPGCERQGCQVLRTED